MEAPEEQGQKRHAIKSDRLDEDFSFSKWKFQEKEQCEREEDKEDMMETVM